jgi:uncharacterized protein (DUF433 family)
MGTDYVERRDGNVYVGPSRVTIDSIIIYWQQGQTPEQLHESFPSVPLAHVYGAIAYYLDHQDEIDAWIRESQELFEKRRAADEAARPEWYASMRQRMAEARERLGLDAGAEASDEPQMPDRTERQPTGPVAES